MPSKTKKQHNLMEGIAHGWTPTQQKYHEKNLPPKKVAKEFLRADKKNKSYKKKP